MRLVQAAGAREQARRIAPEAFRSCYRILYGVPQSSSIGIARRVSFELHNVQRKALGESQPIRPIKEKRLRKYTAPDYKIFAIVWLDLSVLGNSRPHL